MTTGLMWAPLILPTGEIAMSPPVVPNRNPVRSRRSPALGTRDRTGLFGLKSTMTIESPTLISMAVPTNSKRRGPWGPSRCSFPLSRKASSIPFHGDLFSIHLSPPQIETGMYLVEKVGVSLLSKAFRKLPFS